MRKTFFAFLFFGTILFNAIGQVPGACIKTINPSTMDGNGVLGATYNYSECGLNYVQASALIETRFNQYSTATPPNLGTGLPTTVTVAGLPSSGTILKAYAWYVVSYLASPQASSVTITNPLSNTSTISSTNIGQDVSKCWGEAGTVVYRADVTNSISGNGVYGININGITGTSANFPNWYDQIDGITLFIIYKDQSAPYQGSLVIWDGAMVSNSGAISTQTMTGINACGNSSSANAFCIISDMQDNQSANAHPTTLNGVTGTFTNDFWNFDVAPTTVFSGQNTAVFGTDGQASECYAWAMMGLYYQTTSCVVCSPCTTTTAHLDSVINTSACTLNDGAIYMHDSTSAGPLTYSWSNGATTQDISGLSAGTYSVTITDTTGCSISFSTTVSSPSTILAMPDTGLSILIPCSGNNGAIYVNVSGGNTPYSYNWSNGATTQNITGLAYGDYTLTVTDVNGCTALAIFSDKAPSNLPVPDICMVTVDSLSYYNVIMWDKTPFSGVDSFIVYREITTNNYMPIGAVAYDSLSLFVDTVRTKYFPNTGNPNAGTYRYKIQLRDSCSNLSVLSLYHNTIFVSNNNGNFSWPQLYTIEGSANPVGAYVLMRDDSSNGNWHAINSVAGTQQSVSDPAYAMWQNTASWRVQTLWNIACTPTRLTSQFQASFNASQSNMLGVLASSVNQTASFSSLITLYPNPSNGIIHLSSTEIIVELFLIDVVGQRVSVAVNTTGKSIDVSSLPVGVYFLNVKTENGTCVKKIVKE